MESLVLTFFNYLFIHAFMPLSKNCVLSVFQHPIPCIFLVIFISYEFFILIIRNRIS